MSKELIPGKIFTDRLFSSAKSRVYSDALTKNRGCPCTINDTGPLSLAVAIISSEIFCIHLGDIIHLYKDKPYHVLEQRSMFL